MTARAYRLLVKEAQSLARAGGGPNLEKIILEIELIKISDGDFVINEQDRMFGDKFCHVECKTKRRTYLTRPCALRKFLRISSEGRSGES